MSPLAIIHAHMLYYYQQRLWWRRVACFQVGWIDTRIAWYQEIGRSNMLIVGVTGDDRIVIGGPNPRISHAEG